MTKNRLNRITQFFLIDVLENDQLKGRRMNKNRLNRITQFQLKGSLMNKNRLNRITQFQLKGSLMNKNRLNRITQFIGMSLLVAGFVLWPLSNPALAAGTAGTPATGTS